jgi:glycosyltransferase involved in cell wall biosynthesis
MKILMPVHFFLPDHSAGTEVYTYNLARALQARGHEVQIFTSEKELSRRTYTMVERDVDGLRCHVMINNLDHDRFSETFANQRVEAAFQRVQAAFKPDIVHVQHLMLLSLGLPQVARSGGARVVMTLNDFWLYCVRFGQLLLPNGHLCDGPNLPDCQSCLQDFVFSQGKPEKIVIRMLQVTRELSGVDLAPLVYWAQDRSSLLRKRKSATPSSSARAGADGSLREELQHRIRKVRQLVEQVDVFLSPSATVAERVTEWGIPRTKLRISRYGIDTRPFADVARPERPDAKINFGYIGTLAPHKGVHVLIDALRRLPRERCRLLVFGSDAHYADYGRMLRDLAEGFDVTFCGAMDRARIGQAFAQIDCLVMPSLWLENSPVVIQEAFAAGVPVIASGQGGMAELIEDGRSGRLFPAGDVAALAAHMGAVVQNPTTLRTWSVAMDPPRTIEDDAAAMEALYAELLAPPVRIVPGRPGGKGAAGKPAMPGKFPPGPEPPTPPPAGKPAAGKPAPPGAPARPAPPGAPAKPAPPGASAKPAPAPPDAPARSAPAPRSGRLPPGGEGPPGRPGKSPRKP